MNAVCTPVRASSPTCACNSGWAGTGVGVGSCTPSFTALAVNGVDARALSEVQVPVGTTQVTITADTKSVGTVLLINGQDVRTLVVEVLRPLTVVTVQLGNPSISLARSLIVREKPSFSGGATSAPALSYSAVAASDADHFVAGAAGIFGCTGGGVTALNADAGGWLASAAVDAGATGCTGWTVSLSAAGDVLASSALEGHASSLSQTGRGLE